MKKYLSNKTLFYIKIIATFIFSAFIYMYSLAGNKIVDRLVENNIGVCLFYFIIIIILSLYAGYTFDLIKDTIVTKPQNIWYFMKMLNYQILLYSCVYFFCFAIGNNMNMGYGLNKNMYINGAIIAVFLLWNIIKYKKELLHLSRIIGLLIIVNLALQLNYFEILFFAVYFLMLWVFKKVKFETVKNILIKGKNFSVALMIIVSLTDIILIGFDKLEMAWIFTISIVITVAARLLVDIECIFKEHVKTITN